MGKTGVPRLIDPRPYIQAGINPKTGGKLLAASSTLGETSPIKEAFKLALRIKDEQNAVMRYSWYNLPDGLDGELVERMLYYRGQLAFAYIKDLNRFYLLPYTLCANSENPTSLDAYARFASVKLIPFSSVDQVKGDESSNKRREEEDRKRASLLTILSALTFDVKYEVMAGELTEKDLINSAVILKDYTSQLSETNIARSKVNDPIIDLEAACFAYANTAMINSTGVEGMRVNGEDEEENVRQMNRSIERAALNGEKAIPVTGPTDWQELTGGKVTTSDEFMVMAQAIDNERLSLYGLENGGLYQKKTYVNDGQTQMNSGNPSDVYHNGLMIRQKFCDIVNSIWGIGIACEAAEFDTGVDMDGDGTTDNRRDQSGAQEGEQMAGGVE